MKNKIFEVAEIFLEKKYSLNFQLSLWKNEKKYITKFLDKNKNKNFFGKPKNKFMLQFFVKLKKDNYELIHVCLEYKLIFSQVNFFKNQNFFGFIFLFIFFEKYSKAMSSQM